jgi:single-stranded DNA-binding protein
MQLLNRVSLVGRLETEPRVVMADGNRELMTFVLETGQSNSVGSLQRHLVAIEEPLMACYARTYLSQGDLMLVEGQLESTLREEFSQSWVVVSKGHGLLHPLMAGNRNANHSTSVDSERIA